MDYETVELKEKLVAALCARTSNSSPEMSEVIGGLWRKFYSPDCYPKIPNKANQKALGIYTDYADEEKGEYTVEVGCEIKEKGVIPDGSEQALSFITIPGGKYAKFVVRGNMLTAVQDFWRQLWGMSLNRSFICDFEEYQNADPENAEIHIYIGLK